MRNDTISRRHLVNRLSQAARQSALCIGKGLWGAMHCAHKNDVPLYRLWFSFAKRMIRDLDSIIFHEVVPDTYEPKSTRLECTILFFPGYSMTANGASPLLSYLAGAGFQIVTCGERMSFNNVRRITRWAYNQVAVIRARKQTPILLGYSMGGDIAQRVIGKMGGDAVSLSTPIMSQYTFSAALNLILRSRISSRKTFRGPYGASLSEPFSFHIPRPDQEGHVTLKGVYSHFWINHRDVIQSVAGKIEDAREGTSGCLRRSTFGYVFRRLLGFLTPRIGTTDFSWSISTPRHKKAVTI